MADQPNIGWLFQKAYYKDLERYLSKGKLSEIDFDGINQKIYLQKLDQQPVDKTIPAELANCSFQLRTSYPGLMTGTGLNHALGKNDTEVKLGFSFDHTTGLPYLPGSSVKGLLRSLFPGRLKMLSQNNKLSSKQREGLNKKAHNQKLILKKLLMPKAGWSALQIDNIPLDWLEEHLFEGIDADKKPVGVYQRDIIFDAFPIRSFYQGDERDENDPGRFLGEGVITPHKPRRNPVPIKFLKVLPEVSWQFRFRLQDADYHGQSISKAQKGMLFKALIELLGLGAKTNVGFGRLRENPS